MKLDIIMLGKLSLNFQLLMARKHNVMAISRKFEVFMENPTVSTNEDIEHYLTPFLRNCFPSDSVPRDIDDPFHLGKEKQKEKISKRIVYGIRELSFSLLSCLGRIF